jgi:phosphoserine phosphatase
MTELIATDLEGTLTAGQAWRGMRSYLEANQYKRHFRRFYWSKVPNLLKMRLGRQTPGNFKMEWMSGMLHLFAGFSRDEFAEVADWVVEAELWPKRRKDVLDELRHEQENGRSIVIVTGIFEPIISRFAEKAGGFDFIGTPVEYNGDLLTGKTAAPFNLGAKKVESLKPYTINAPLYAAYGDTAPDIPMLKSSQRPVAVYPDAELRETAVSLNWRIIEKES